MSIPYRVGVSPLRRDGLAKATGQAGYTRDLRRPGMLHGATLRSPHAHAEIVRLGWKDGQAPEGVTLVTAQDVPVNGIFLLDDSWPVLADGVVRHVGEPVALVAAADRRAARRALAEIEVEYAPLEPVLTLEQAAAEPPFAVSSLDEGDVEQGLAGADLVVEGTYRTHRQEHVYLEPQVMTAWTEDGILNVAGSLQNLFFVHLGVSYALQIPFPFLRVRALPVGGGFGGKEDHPSLVAVHAALLSQATGQPVSLAYGRGEDFVSTSKRHPAVVRHRTGVDAEGRLVAMDVDVTLDSGAYATLSPAVLLRALLHATGPYRCPNVRIRARALGTHTVPNGALRGFGGPQVHFAVERQMDAIARRMDLDPYEIRARNVVLPGDSLPCGQVLDGSTSVLQCLEEAVERTDFRRRWRDFEKNREDGRPRCGLGLSVFFHGAGLTNNFEELFHPQVRGELRDDGRIEILHAAVEMGQGSLTVLLQIACEAGGLTAEDVFFAATDSGRVPDSGPTDSSRTTMIVGLLIAQVVEELRDQVVAAWAAAHGVSDELYTCAGYVCGPEGELVTFQEAVLEYLESLGPLAVTKLYEPPGEFDVVTNKGDAFASYGWGAEVVEVEVDPDTLEVRPTSLTAVCDVGKVVHPTLCRGQIEGAALQGVGLGLLEEVRYGDDGHPVHDRLAKYNTPTMKDTPRIDVHFLENPYEGGPFGARGAGELAIEGAAPAAVQAVENATGQSLDEIPVTPEKLARSVLRSRA